MMTTEIKSVAAFLLTIATCITLQRTYHRKIKEDEKEDRDSSSSISDEKTLPNNISSRSICDVLVAGTGAAGIAAARTLISAGLSVVVLEGNDYIGGRVRSSSI
jgi:NADPH-dependent 2,4-dienoyl-CoA reductase/sulfur reductase-like enzyme